MILKVYSVYDAKAGLFGNPFVSRSRGEAVRSFMDIAQDVSHPIGKHPGDYSLLELGSWDDQNAHFTQDNVPENLGSALQYLNPGPAEIEELKA